MDKAGDGIYRYCQYRRCAPRARLGCCVLRAIRADLGMTQPALADVLSVGTETLRGWESGRRSLTAMQLHAYPHPPKAPTPAR